MESQQQREAVTGGCIRLGGFELDLERGELRAADGSQATLRSKALDALIVLAEHAGHVVTKDEIMARVWPGVVVTEDSLTQLVNRIRRVLGDTDHKLLRTVSRRGYVLVVERVVAAIDPPNRGDAHLAIKSNLPMTTTPLCGRASDLGAVADLVRHHRLVTIAGAGGIGKTSLALEVARSAVDDFAHGVWWVDLTPLSDPAQVLPAVAAALGIELRRGDARRRLAGELSGRDLLLVLDNCEHVVAEVADVVRALFESCSRIKVLATSQEPLKTPVEHLYRLGVLDVPPQGVPLSAAAGYGAFQLFEQRAIATKQDFVLDDRSAALVIDICRSLDGLPLAIEMAAARACTLGVGGVHALLGDRLRVLRTASRMVPARQETLRATLEWSCSLLSETELSALRRLAIFAGAFDMKLATEVITEGSDEGWWPLDTVCSLADKSLLRIDQQEPARFRLLESTRLLAREMLVAAGQEEAVTQKHCHAMARVGLEISSAYYQGALGDDEFFARYAVFYADFERAFEHACLRTDADAAAAILVGLRWLDQLRGDTESTQGRIEKCLPLLPNEVCAARARVMGVIASCGWLSIAGFPPRDAAAYAVQAWRQLDSEPGALGHALLRLAAEAAREGRCEEARSSLAEGEQILSNIGNPKLHLLAAVYAGHVAMFCGPPEAHYEIMSKALMKARDLGASRLARYILTFLPGAALAAADARRAISLGSEAAHEMRALHQRYYLTNILADLVRALIEVGEIDRARSEAIEALPLAWEFGHQADLARHVAQMALRTDRVADGAALAGYAAAQYGSPRNAVEARACADCEVLRKDAIHALGPLVAGKAYSAGSLLGHDGAFALAGAVLGMPDGGSE